MIAPVGFVDLVVEVEVVVASLRTSHSDEPVHSPETSQVLVSALQQRLSHSKLLSQSAPSSLTAQDETSSKAKAEPMSAAKTVTSLNICL